MSAQDRIAADPTALEQSIRDLCAAHDVQSFKVGLLLPSDRNHLGWNISLQRWDDETPIECALGSGSSIVKALTEALSELTPITAKLADEALPQVKS